MTSRVLLEHHRPNGAEPERCDRLLRIGRSYVVHWSALIDETERDPHVESSIYRTAAEALSAWYLFPRTGERHVGRFPPGFERARRAAKGER